MSETTIDALKLEIKSSSSKATRDIDSLTKSLDGLQKVISTFNADNLTKMLGELSSLTKGNSDGNKSGSMFKDMQSDVRALNEAVTIARNNLNHLNSQLGKVGTGGNGIKNITSDLQKASEQTAKFVDGLNQTKSAMSAKVSTQDMQAPSDYNPDADGKKNAKNAEATRDALRRVHDQTKMTIAVVNALGTVMRNVFSNSKKVVFGLVGAFKSLAGTMARIGIGGLAKTIGQLSLSGKMLSSTFGKLKSMFTGGRNASNGFNASLGSGIKTLLKYGLGIRSVYALVNKLRGAMVNGFKNLAQSNGAILGNLQALSATLTNVQNALAVAFAPVLNVVVPILNTLADYAIMAANAIAQFFAVLTGQSTYVKATKAVSGAVAGIGDSASGATGKVKELKRQLMGFDVAERLDDNSSSGGGGGGGGGGTGVDIGSTEVANASSDFAEKIKKAWSDADFTEIGNIIGKKLKKALDDVPMDKIEKSAKKVGKSVATFLNGFFETKKLADSLGKTIGGFVNTGLSGVNSFIKNLHFKSIGKFIADGMNSYISTLKWKKIGTTIRNGLNGLFDLASTWSGKFNFKQLGTQITKAINGALTGIKWKEAVKFSKNTGKGIADALNKIINKDTFAKIGNTVGNVVNTVIAGAYSFVSNAKWGQWGTAIATALRRFFNKVDWEQAGLTFNKAVNGIIKVFRNAIEGVSWDSVGNKIAKMIKAIDFKGLLSSVGSLIWLAVKKAVHTYNLAFSNNKITGIVIAAFSAVKFTGLGTAVSNLIWLAIKNKIAGSAAKKMAKEIAKEVGNVLGESGVTNAVSTALEGTTDSVATGGGLSTVAGGLIELFSEGGLIGGITLAGVKLAEFFDSANGGNGVLTELGGSLDSINNYLTAEHKLTNDQSKAMFNFKENMEDTTFSAVDYANELSNCGISADDFYEALIAVQSQGGLTDEQLKFLYETLDILKGKEDGAKKSADAAATSIGDMADKVKNLSQNSQITIEATLGGKEVTEFEKMQVVAEVTGVEYDLTTDEKTIDDLYGQIVEAYESKDLEKPVVDADANLKGKASGSKTLKDLFLESKSGFEFLSKLKGTESGSKLLKDLYLEKGGVFGFLSSLKGKQGGSKTLNDSYLGKDGLFGFRSKLIGKLNGSKTVEDSYLGKNGLMDFRSRFVGMLANSKKIKDSYLDKDGYFGFKSNMTGKAKGTNSLGGLFGYSLLFPAKMTGKADGSWTLGTLFGTVLYFMASMSQSRTGSNGKVKDGGIITSSGISKLPQFSSGGVISNTKMVGSIPQYASGGIPSHGTQFFIAGERGAEIVGNVGNGTTEVLNKSQIASAIYQAVKAAMAENGGTNVYLQGDARGLFEVVRKENNKRVMATGRAQLMT